MLRLVRAHPDHDIVIGVDSLGKGGAMRGFEGDRTNACIWMYTFAATQFRPL